MKGIKKKKVESIEQEREPEVVVFGRDIRVDVLVELNDECITNGEVEAAVRDQK